MSAPAVTVALLGNPNTGKSTLFNALSGLRQHVGNYAGVTVELKTGRFEHAGRSFTIIDLPGTYSLAARSPDELVAVDLLLGRRSEAPRPDVILSIVDASNIERHLFLTSQLMELGVPVVLAVNMIDVAAALGTSIDVEKLSQSLGVPVVAIQANRGTGLEDLKAALHAAAAAGGTLNPPRLPEVVEREAEALRHQLNGDCPAFLARRLLLDDGGSAEQWFVGKHGAALAEQLKSARQRLADAGCPIPAAEARTRYAWIRSTAGPSITRNANAPRTRTDRIDRVLTHKIFGTLIFLAIMLAVFLSIFIFAEPLMEAINSSVRLAQEAVQKALPPGPVQGLLADGIIGGVGSVLVFLPQILILFGFLAVLEDCGYMARAAFLMDRIMSRCGLSGKAFIPLLSSVACAIPGIMATRVIEQRRDRLATILVAPLMSCSARLPVYSLLIGAFLGPTSGYPAWVGGVTLFGMYMIGFVTAPIVALLLKRTLLRGAAPAYVMELPLYKRPSLRAVLRRMLGAGGAFLKRAGTLILAAMVLVWAATYFPNRDAGGESYHERVAQLEDAGDEETARALQGEWQRQSVLGRAGQALEPVFAPLGWDWKLGMAALASFPAREVVVGTLGIVYDLGPVEDDDEATLGQAIHADWASDPFRSRYAVPVALSVMVFFALCCQCVSTLAIILKETRSWWWPVFTFVYMTVLAYVGAWATTRIGVLIVNAL